MMKGLCSQRLIRCSWLFGVLLTFLLSASFTIAANSPNFDNQKGFPQYVVSEFDSIKKTLEQHGQQLGALSTQLASVETNLGADLDEALTFLDKEEKNIKISTTMCFSASVFSKLTGGGKVELGAGWPNIAWAKGVGVIDWKALGGGISIGDKICIKIPLYSTASDKNWIENANFDTAEFDELIGHIAQPSQYVIPFLANAYGELVPNPQAAFQAVNNISLATTGYNVYTDTLDAPNPAVFLDGFTVFEPVIADSAVLQSTLPGLPTALINNLGNPNNVAATLGGMHVPIPGVAGNTAGLDAFLDIIDPLGVLH